LKSIANGGLKSMKRIREFYGMSKGKLENEIGGSKLVKSQDHLSYCERISLLL